MIILLLLNQTETDLSSLLHARDKGGPPKTGSATLYVTITDANNQIPKFNKTNYQTRIKEDEPIGTVALNVLATDIDSTSLLRYYIKPGSHLARKPDGSNIVGTFQYDYTKAFIIEPLTGVIKTNMTLRRDGAAEISFIVVVEDTKAEDNKPQTAEASVLIIILGRNDTTPYYDGKRADTDPRYYFQLPENTAVDNLITSLQAIDPTGLPINNYVKVPGSGDLDNLFRVDKLNGQIFVSKVPDYEALRNKLQSFKVRATTQDGIRYVDATVNIEIKDVNDNPPVFIHKNYTFRIPEDKDFTYEIGPVIARDADGGSFAAIEYSLFDPVHNDFMIESNQYKEGIIRVKRNTSLDFEKVSVYNLLVFAKDNLPTSTDRQTASVKVTIFITDVNDNYPQFTRPSYSFFTVETFDIGVSVGLITATDKDKDNYGEVYYYFEDIPGTKPATQYFEIEQATGLIKIKSSLQGTAANSPYRLYVRAVDNPEGAPQLSNITTVSINVSSGQIDEGRPVWITPKATNEYMIQENSPPNTVIVTAEARARTPGAGIIYSILYNDDSRLFKINNVTGVVTTTERLDREQKQDYVILLLGVDSKNSSLQSTNLLKVKVLDENDETPSFRNCPDVKYARPEIVSVYEREPRDTFVFKAKACDRDLYPNNQVMYDFYSPEGHRNCFANVSESFSLDASTGIITTRKVLDRELQPSYLLCVRAIEQRLNGRRKRQTYNFTNENEDTILFLHVNILDINDMRPTFPYTLINDRIFDLPQSDKVTQVQAYDGDSSEFNKIRYTITNVMLKDSDGRVIPIYNTPFNIDPATGMISVALRSYVTFVGGYFNLTVRAEDSKNISMWDSVVVRIFVLKAYYQVRVVIPTDRFGDDVQGYVDQMLNELNTKYPDFLFKDTITRYHKTLTGSSIDRTDVCMVVIQKDKVLDSYQATRELNKINDVLRKYGSVSTGPCEPVSTARLEGWVAFWWVLVAFAIFIFVATLILIYAIWALYRNYRNYMNTQKTYLVQ
ncbi:hypothetical protein KUTeg_003095 [Tegillarca granosa]|uniref:Cadherin domain-containing protein n=1 Tax=Tegillarca granosa TaxID=220873 RepID=A0ABQ9FL48_TEGGR|nr:hypothetical protein KUTeg_003095 [Tegillarca granosa]